MFLFPAVDIQDDNGTIALLAEDFNFASLWRLDTSEQDGAKAYEDDRTFMAVDSLSPVI
jgi:hypothetical protein